MPLKTIRNIFISLAILVITFGVGYRFGQHDYSLALFSGSKPSLSVVNRDFGLASHNIDFSLFWDVWDRLDKSYISKEKIEPQKMLYGAISGMVGSLDDPYTVFLPPKQNKETKEELGGSFEGIGAQLGLKDKKIVVIAPLLGTPAEKQGIKPGDFILSIDGKSTDNLTLPEAVSKIRGQKGTKVVLSILHDKETKPKEIAIIRDTIMVKSVELTFKQAPNGKIAYLVLSRFGDETEKEWNKAVTEIKGDNGIKGLILDLRNNPGGYLSGAVYIGSEFLDKGKTVVVQENANGTKQNYIVERDASLIDIPMVVLINKGSASASEIVSGALSDYKRAKLVGEKTFGKGSVQEAQDLPGGSGLHVTTAKWLLPYGKWINGTGIEPDIKVEMDEKNPEKDPQLEKAIEILTK